MAAIEDATGNTAQKDLTDQEFTSGKSSDIDLSDLTFYVLKVGDYVYKDGTTGTEFVEGNTIAKVFWLGDPTVEDIQLKKDYPNCTNGLAYEVNESGNILINESKGWYYATKINSYNGLIGYSTKVHYEAKDKHTGFYCSSGIKELINDGMTQQSGYFENIVLTTPAAEGTSSWYIPNYLEAKTALDGLGVNGYFWISSTKNVSGSVYSSYYLFESDFKSEFNKDKENKVFKILAF